MYIKVTEKDFRETFSPCFIKVATEKSHLEELINGVLYMKASGYYRKLDDNYRGDPFDGRTPVDPNIVRIVVEDPESGKRLFFDEKHGTKITELSYGFKGDDRVPMFCMTKLEPDIMTVFDDYSYVIAQEYVEELTKFGKYFAIIDAQEFVARVENYNKSNTNKFIGHSVRYMTLEEMTRNSFENKLARNGYSSFFSKLDGYKYQNEWRLVLQSNIELIGEKKDYVRINIGGPIKATILPIEQLGKIQFKINCIEE